MNCLGAWLIVLLLTAGFLVGFVNCIRWSAWLTLCIGRKLHWSAGQLEKLQIAVEGWIGKKWREERA